MPQWSPGRCGGALALRGALGPDPGSWAILRAMSTQPIAADRRIAERPVADRAARHPTREEKQQAGRCDGRQSAKSEHGFASEYRERQNCASTTICPDILILRNDRATRVGPHGCSVTSGSSTKLARPDA